ncbi:MAG: DUF4160 domain-containing protein [Bacillota bacterium]
MNFFGIVIAIYYNDHEPSHFHAIYGEHSGTFAIKNLQMIEGSLPRRAISLVLEWAFFHRKELERNWKLAKEHKSLLWIEPLE